MSRLWEHALFDLAAAIQPLWSFPGTTTAAGAVTKDRVVAAGVIYLTATVKVLFSSNHHVE